MYSRLFLLKVCPNRSATVWAHIRVRKTLQYKIWSGKCLPYPNCSMFCTTPMDPVTTARQITNADILNAEAVVSMTLIRIPCRQLSSLRRMHRPLDLDPHQRQCRYGAKSSAPRNRLHPHCQCLQSTMRHYAVSVWPAAIQRRKVRPFHLSSAQPSSIRPKPTSLLSQYASHANFYCRRSPLKYGCRPTTQRSIKSSKYAPPT